jgi:hypothetical protein
MRRVGFLWQVMIWNDAIILHMVSCFTIVVYVNS